MSLNPLVRVYYQEGLLLTAELCDVEQTYTKNITSNQNTALFSSGVISGLQLAGPAGSTSITVTAGVALDAKQQQLILASDTSVPISSSLANSTIYISIAYDESVDPVTHLITEQPQIILASTPPENETLLLGIATTSGGALVTLSGKQSYVLINDEVKIANNIPPVLMHPFIATINPPEPAANVTSVVCDFPTMPFVATQVLVSVQDNDANPGIFSASVATLTATQFTANVLFTAIGEGVWTSPVILNCIAWKS